MRTLKRLFTILTALLLLAPATWAQTADLPEDTPHVLVDSLILDGTVDRLLTEGIDLVRIDTLEGVTLDVPLENLLPFTGHQIGYQELVPDMDVTARMHPGVLSLEQGDRDLVWITVDGDRFARFSLADLNQVEEGLFDDASVVVRDENGNLVQTSVANSLRHQALQLEAATR